MYIIGLLDPSRPVRAELQTFAIRRLPKMRSSNRRFLFMGVVVSLVLVLVASFDRANPPPVAIPLSTSVPSMAVTGTKAERPGDPEGPEETREAGQQLAIGGTRRSRADIVPDMPGIVVAEGDTANTSLADEFKPIQRVPIAYLQLLASVPVSDEGWLTRDDGNAPSMLPRMNRSNTRQEAPNDLLAAAKGAEEWYASILSAGVLPFIDRNVEPFHTAPPGVTAEPVWSERTSIALSELRGANAEPSPHKKVAYTDQAADEGAAFERVAASNWQIKQKEDLEFVRPVPPVHWYLKPKEELLARWTGMEPAATREGHRSVVRVACLYAGFLRDYKQMFEACRGKECTGKNSKSYGSQRANILDSSRCDVYMSTWDIVGAGRYFSTTYDMKKAVTLEEVKSLYGDRLAGLHVQRYAVYERVWRLMSGVARLFPQVRVAHSSIYRFWGLPEANYIFRSNDYSQSYKHWCVVQLSLLAGLKHDVYLRLRPDLRTTGRLASFGFAREVRPVSDGWKPIRNAVVFTVERPYARKRPMSWGSTLTPEELAFERYGANITANPLLQGSRVQYLNSGRVHVQNFDYSDFGFMGGQDVIQHLTLPWMYCLMPPSGASDYTTLSPTTKPGMNVISEYNLVLWRIIFDNRWEVDDGRMYLRVNRMRGAKR